MPPARTHSWLPIAALLVPVALGLGWLLLGFGGQRSGYRTLPLSTNADTSATEVRIETFHDADAQRSIEAIAQLPNNRWVELKDEGSLSVYRGGALWLRYAVRNRTATAQRSVLVSDYFFTDYAELWSRPITSAANGGDPGWQRQRSGEAVEVKALPAREIAFPLEVPPHAERVVYARFQDHFRSPVFPGWWPHAEDFEAARSRLWLAEGIYFGGLLALLGYNALLWLRLRLRDIGFYVLYLGAIAAFMWLARAMPQVFGFPLGSPAVETLITIAMALSAFLLVQFARAFLDLPARMPREDRVARGLAWLNFAVAVATLSTPWMPVGWMWAAVPASAATHALLTVFAVKAMRQDIWQARYFLLAFGCVFIGALGSATVWALHIPGDAGLHILMIGSALEMLLLSLAVAERFAEAQRERLRAQEALATETERRRALQEAYADELEAEVRDRTRELEEANADKDRMLAIVGHDLRSPIAGLMRAADDEPGNFARETARTGRAVLLLIEDLVLWARLRAGVRQVAAHPAHNLLVPAVALHRALAERGGTELVVTAPEGLRVETDLVLAQTLVRNLLANALKFARTRVTIRAEETREGGVRFTVGNDGPPLPSAVAARFASGENEPMTATGGLGLRLCREICRALGLKLEAGSGTDGGTEFWFTLKSAPTTANPTHDSAPHR